MPGRWSEDRERGWDARRQDDDRRDASGGRGREGRSFEGDDREAFDRNTRGTYERQDRNDRVFGERESGAAYNRPLREVRPDYSRNYATDYSGGQRGASGGYRGGQDDGRPDWQDRDYGGVSPAFRQHERDFETGYRAYPRGQGRDYSGGGRFYGDDGRERIYREEYAYGADPAYAQGRRFGTREADERYERALHRPNEARTWSGGTGGYDYERGYGDGGREETRRDFEDRARDAGEFFRRTGRKVANWFSDVAGEGSEMGRYEDRGHRGRGPKGYKRSDERISDDVHQRLTDDPWLDASEIDVKVSGGEVTLTGTVETREAKHEAERLVERVSGVDHVQNNLRVKQGGGSGAATGHSFGDGASEAQMRTQGDASMETSANATGTTTRKN